MCGCSPANGEPSQLVVLLLPVFLTTVTLADMVRQIYPASR